MTMRALSAQPETCGSLGIAPRRDFLAAVAAAVAAISLPSEVACAQDRGRSGGLADVSGKEHWTVKRAGADSVKLFLWRKQLKNASAAGASDSAPRGTILFVHGSSVSATPVFDLQIPGKPEASTMDWFARRGYDTWCVDCEGYGRSDKSRPVNADVSCGADDLAVASEYIVKQNGGAKLLLYGASSGALRAGLFAQRHPERVQRVALDALVWTGEGSPTLAERKKRLPEYRASNRRPIDRAFVRSIFTRDHPGTSDLTVVEAFADAVLALGMVLPHSRISPISSPDCPIRTSNSSSCPASPTPARARRTGRSSITCSTLTSASRHRCMSAEVGEGMSAPGEFHRARAFARR